MNKYFIVAMAMIYTFTACNKEIDTNALNGYKSVSISIELKNIASFAKSVNGDVVDEDAAINDLIVFIVRNDGNFDIGPVYFESSQFIGDTLIPSITASTMATKVYIVCNTGPFDTGPFRNVRTLSDVERMAMSVDGNPNTQSNCVSGNVWMSGNSPLEAGGTVGGVETKTASVSLQFLPSKVYVIVRNEMTNYSPTGSVLLDGIAVVNGGAWTGFINAGGSFKPLRSDISTPGNVPFFYNGITIDPANWQDMPAPVNSLPDFEVRSFYNFNPSSSFPILTSPITIIPAANEGFYVFPLITINKTYVTVYGRFALEGVVNSTAPTPYFWSFVFGGRNYPASNIIGGQKYLITMALRGNANVGGGGTTDPTEEVINASVNISVVAAQWSPALMDRILN